MVSTPFEAIVFGVVGAHSMSGPPIRACCMWRDPSCQWQELNGSLDTPPWSSIEDSVHSMTSPVE